MEPGELRVDGWADFRLAVPSMCRDALRRAAHDNERMDAPTRPDGAHRAGRNDQTIASEPMLAGIVPW